MNLSLPTIIGGAAAAITNLAAPYGRRAIQKAREFHDDRLARELVRLAAPTAQCPDGCVVSVGTHHVDAPYRFQARARCEKTNRVWIAHGATPESALRYLEEHVAHRGYDYITGELDCLFEER